MLQVARGDAGSLARGARRPGQRRQEGRAVERKQIDIGPGDDRRRPRDVADERQLPTGIPRAQRRDRKAALKFLKKSMKRHGSAEVIVTGRLRSYGAALHDIPVPSRMITYPLGDRRFSWQARF